MSEIRGMAEVKYVERNQVVRALQAECDEVQEEAPWGLVRTTERDWGSDPPTEYQYRKEGRREGTFA